MPEELGLGTCHQLIGLRQFLDIACDGHQRIVKDLDSADLQHVQDDLRVLRIVLVPAVVNRLPGRRQNRLHRARLVPGERLRRELQRAVLRSIWSKATGVEVFRSTTRKRPSANNLQAVHQIRADQKIVSLGWTIPFGGAAAAPQTCTMSNARGKNRSALAAHQECSLLGFF